MTMLFSSFGPRMTAKPVPNVMGGAMSIADSSVKEMSAKSPISMLGLSHALNASGTYSNVVSSSIYDVIVSVPAM
jgi:hypothetical protein